MKTKIFLDLENCLIESWENPVFTDKDLKSILDKEFDFSQIDREISIFSWAIWDERDLEIFNNTLKENIEKFLDVKVINVVTKNDLIKILKRKFPIQDPSDVNDFFDKRMAFFHFCELEDICCSILIDDTVPREFIEINKIVDGESKMRTIDFINFKF